MKTWNVIVKQDEKDCFDIACSQEEGKFIIPTYNYTDSGYAVNSKHVFEEIGRRSDVIPSTNAFDLLNIAIGVYTSDQLISRKSGYQNWSRHFKLFLPVSSLSEWIPLKVDFQNLLSFLSGDKWEIFFREKKASYKPENRKRINKRGIGLVSLFSGGLDSYISAIDLLDNRQKVAFISHYKGGQESKVQTMMHETLKNKYGASTIENFSFYVQPNQKHPLAIKESTSRARSFLFLCLGISIANGYGDAISLIVPENGLISLNVPLTGTRLSSHSTRTTHPYYLSGFSNLLRKLGIENGLHNPYQFLTKGEMMLQCRDQAFLKTTYKDTLSCSHPDNSRFRGKSPGMHCGYCVPCIIRQASEKGSGIRLTEYDWDIVNAPPDQTSGSGSDLRAFKLALERLKNKSERNILMDILSTGPLPFKDKSELDNYIGVYRRGMKEVEDFLI